MNTQRPDSAVPREAASVQRTVSVARGNIYLSREICDTYLAGIASVALIAREDKILIVPLVQESGGGLLLKTRNARGDRVIQAQEFFREKGFLEDFQERIVPVQWSSESAALVMSDLPKTSG